MTRRGKAMALGGILLVAFGAGAWFYKRNLHKLAFIPAAPSRAMSHEPVTPEPAGDEQRVLYVGHSLINEHVPVMTQQIAAHFGVEWTFASQLTSGGCLQVNWNREEEERQGRDYTGPHARVQLREGEWDVLVLAEAVSINDMIRWMKSPEYLNRWYDLAVSQQGNDLRVFLYEVWDERFYERKIEFVTLPGTWQEHTRKDLDKWEHIVDSSRDEREEMHPDGPPVFLIPGGQAMVDVVEAVEAGQVPHVNDVEALFADGVHLSPLGNYYIALVHFATIARRSPLGAPHEVVDGAGVRHAFEPDTAAKLQALAWEAVRTYPRQGFTAPR